jgi:hypothetical protein
MPGNGQTLANEFMKYRVHRLCVRLKHIKKMKKDEKRMKKRRKRAVIEAMNFDNR